MGLKDRIRARRKDLGLSQKDVADRMGIPSYNIANWEQGRAEPSVENLQKLAKSLECSLWDFMGPPDDPRERGAVPIYKSIRCGAMQR